MQRDGRVPSLGRPSPGPLSVDPPLLGPWYWGPVPLVLRSRPDGLLSLGPLDGPGRTSRFRATAHDEEWVGLDGYYAGEVLHVVRGPGDAGPHLDLATFVLTRQPYEGEVPGGADPGGWVPLPRPRSDGGP